MKKNLVFVAIIGFIMIAFCGCGEKKITVKGADGTEYESYQECCTAQDFQAAHQFLAKMQNAAINMEDGDAKNNAARAYKIAYEEVFKQEALFLMSQGDDAAKQRLVYLLKEEGGNNSHVSMLIDLAIENDDEAFVKTLANQYTQGANEESLKKLMDYLFEKSQNDNKEFIGKLFKKIEAEDLLLELAIKDGDKQFIRDYASKYLSLSNTTLLNYLAETKDKKNSEMILGLLADEAKNIPSRPGLGMVQSNYDGELDGSYDSYISSVNSYNDDCEVILQIAIASKNQYLAQRVVNYAKSNIASQKVGSWRIVEKSYNGTSLKAIKVSIDNTEKNSIKAAYQDAVRSGAFR